MPDLRNSKVFDIIRVLDGLGYAVDAHDPLADAVEAASVYGVNPLAGLAGASGYDCVIGAVAHGAYRDLGPVALAALLKPGGLLADVKGCGGTRPCPTALACGGFRALVKKIKSNQSNNKRPGTGTPY